MCEGNCKCSRELADAIADDYGNGIKTKFIKKEWGDQLVFAVTEEGINVETVDIVDEIEDEIINYLNSNRDTLVDSRFISKVEKIFNKYRK